MILFDLKHMVIVLTVFGGSIFGVEFQIILFFNQAITKVAMS
jgi:hypothetical protein